MAGENLRLTVKRQVLAELGHRDLRQQRLGRNAPFDQMGGRRRLGHSGASPPARGAWRDKLTPDGSWIEEPAPGSSLYHITSALAELIETAAAGPAETKRHGA